MIALGTKRHRSTAPLAALLLLLQALAGGAVSLAHASERTTAPAAIESQHTTHCLVLHDALKCPQCQYTGAYPIGRQGRGIVSAHPVAEPYAAGADLASPAAPEDPASRPRAPPAFLS